MPRNCMSVSKVYRRQCLSELPRDTPFFVICAAGSRSRQVVDHLRTEGLHAINVAGGSGGWAQRGWPLEA